jgi:hypothetical protein
LCRREIRRVVQLVNQDNGHDLLHKNPKRPLTSKYSLQSTLTHHIRYSKTLFLPTTSFPIRPDPQTADQIGQRSQDLYKLQVNYHLLGHSIQMQ